MELKSLLSSLVSLCVDGVSRFVSDEVVAHRARLKGKVASSSDSLELQTNSTVEQFFAVKRGGRASTDSPKT